MSKLMKGTFILTMASLLSKVLGFLYIIPFFAIVGEKGIILFEYAFKPYMILMSLATLGIPLAISKKIASFHDEKDTKKENELMVVALWFSILAGVLAFFVLFLSSPYLADFVISDSDGTGNNKTDVVSAIQMVSFALLIVPAMAVGRGYFQGKENMVPTAASQVVEQFTRIAFLLGSAYVVMSVSNKMPFAVSVASFSGFLGAVMGVVVLLFFFKKEPRNAVPAPSSLKPNWSLLPDLIRTAFPFILIALALPLFQLLDTYTLNGLLTSKGVTQAEAETTNALLSLNQKIVFLPTVLATSLGLSLIPLLSKMIATKQIENVANEFKKAYALLFFYITPFVLILMFLPTESFTVLFGPSHAVEGAELMKWYAPTGLLFSFYMVSASITQGLGHQRFAILSLTAGVAVKVFTQHFWVSSYDGIGAIIGTDVAIFVSLALNLLAISYYTNYRAAALFKECTPILIPSFFLSLTLWGLCLTNVSSPLMRCSLFSIIGGIVYVFAYRLSKK